MPNYAIALGSFAGGKVWIEDEQGTSLDEKQNSSASRILAGHARQSSILSTRAGSTKSSHTLVTCGPLLIFFWTDASLLHQ